MKHMSEEIKLLMINNVQSRMKYRETAVKYDISVRGIPNHLKRYVSLGSVKRECGNVRKKL